MKITGKKLLIFCLLLTATVILGVTLYCLSLTRLNNCEYHAEVNRRVTEMLVLARVEIPQYLADNPDISQKEFTEYAEKIRKERNFFIDDNLTQWKNPDNESDAVAIRDCSAINSGYYRFNGTRRLNNCEYHAEVNRRVTEMLVLARVEISQYLADNPDISQKEFTEYAEKIRKERNFFIDDNLTQWKNPDNESDAVAIRDCSAINSGYYRFNGTRSR